MKLRKTSQDAPHAVRRPVSSESPGGRDVHDYADCFEVPLRADDDRTAEQLVRAGLEGAPFALRLIVVVAHRHILRFRLGPASSPTHILGWQIVTSEPDGIQLEASGPLMRGVLAARRGPAPSAVLHTCVYYRRPHARAIWACVSPVHRAIAPYLLKRAASALGAGDNSASAS
jgi:hypothetical protein